MDTLPFRVGSWLALAHLGPAGFRAKLAGPPRLALPWLGAAAVAGQLDAQAMLGQWFLAGRGMPRDPTRAQYWFKRAALAGHAGAANLLGGCYENAWGAMRDERAAAHWYRTAAERGSDWGMYNLATSLVLGRGTGQDRRAALAWFLRAAAAGHAKSLNVVGGFHEDGWEVARDRVRAAAYYCRAARGGDFRGGFNHARLLALDGREAEAQWWIGRVLDSANPPFLAKMLDYLRHAPQAPLRRLGAVAEAGLRSRVRSRGSQSSA